MRIHLEPLVVRPGGSLEIGGFLNYSFADLGRGQGFITPVKVTGVVQNRAGVLTLDYQTAFTLSLICDRCLAGVERDFALSFSHLLAPTPPGDEDSEIIHCSDGYLDMMAVSVDDIFPNLPMQVLCRPDCRGLCPTCGADRNHRDCGHGQEDSGENTGDPRWAALKNLKLGDEN